MPAPSQPQNKNLRALAEEYERVIASFEAINANLRSRRMSGGNSVAAPGERSLVINEKTVATLKQGLRLIREQLK